MVLTLPPHLVQQQVPTVDWRQQILVFPKQIEETVRSQISQTRREEKITLSPS